MLRGQVNILMSVKGVRGFVVKGFGYDQVGSG